MASFFTITVNLPIQFDMDSDGNDLVKVGEVLDKINEYLQDHSSNCQILTGSLEKDYVKVEETNY